MVEESEVFCIPEYEPGLWNDGDGVQYTNNCYNYACDIQNGSYAQPGHASGNMYQMIDCPNVGPGAVSDGLIETDCEFGCGRHGCCHQVALVIAPGFDYHWYRRDRNGLWSHKPGETEATNLDNAGDFIIDPRTADRGPYTIFCGCYCVCKDRVSIAGS